MTRVEFSNSRAEDALNIVRSELTLTECVFSASAFDALDVDYSAGALVGCSFKDSGNDALDLSGTTLEVRDLQVVQAGDKAISVGEASALRGTGVRIEGSRIGLAAKDSSTVELSNVTLRRCEVGLAAYQKKSEFGPARIDVTEFTTEAVNTECLVELESAASINGEQRAATERRLLEQLYPDAGSR